MHCEACVSKIEEALYNIKGIEKVAVNLKNEMATIQGDAKIDKIINIIDDLGYTARLNNNSEIKESTVIKLFPLYLSFLYITAGSLIINRSEFILGNFIISPIISEGWKELPCIISGKSISFLAVSSCFFFLPI